MNKLASVALGLSALMCLSGAAFAVNPAVPPAKPVAPKPVAPKPIAPKPNLGPRKPIAPTFDHARKRKAATNQQMWQAQQKANEALQTIDRLVSTGVFKVNDVPPKPPMIKPALPPKAAANNTARDGHQAGRA